MSFWAAFPLFAYTLVAYLGSLIFKLKLTFETTVDALLLQAYFTASGSFLPLTTDIHYIGDSKAKAHLAIFNLTILFFLNLTLFFIGEIFNLPQLQYIAGMFHIYAFIFSFPLSPLDGAHIWKYNKILWGIIWILLIIAFNYTIPSSLYTIL